MIRAFFFLVIISLFFSCQKNNDTPTPPGLADQFVGNWEVRETVYRWVIGTLSSEKKLHVVDTFFANTAKLTDSTFATIQTLRIPKPAWVYDPNYNNLALAADSLGYLPIVSTRILASSMHASNYGNYSENKDTLHLFYTYGGAYIFEINQTWIRKK